MVSLRPIPYADHRTCEQEAIGAIKYWRRHAAIPGAKLKAVCKQRDELCNLVAMRNEAPLILTSGATISDRFKPSAVAERIGMLLRVLCRERAPDACED
jgi:hypothetical protein